MFDRNLITSRAAPVCEAAMSGSAEQPKIPWGDQNIERSGNSAELCRHRDELLDRSHQLRDRLRRIPIAY